MSSTVAVLMAFPAIDCRPPARRKQFTQTPARRPPETNELPPTTSELHELVRRFQEEINPHFRPPAYIESTSAATQLCLARSLRSQLRNA